MSFVCFTGSYDETKQLVKVRRKYKKKGAPIQTDLKTNLSEGHENYVKEVVIGLSLGKGEFVICVMWVKDVAKRDHRLHPEVLGFDVTFGTNAKKRGLHRGFSKSPDLRNLPNVNAFMSSTQA